MLLPIALFALTGRAYQPPVRICSLELKDIKESSGLAPSYDHRGDFYTHNDSGDRPRLWRFSEKGKIKAEYNLKDASAIDWEDMASAKIGKESYLFLADIGDNLKARKNIKIHRVAERQLDRNPIPYATYELTYPNGPRDAEAFFVDPKTGDFYIVEKTKERRSKVFIARNPKIGKVALTELGSIPIGSIIPYSTLVTGAAVSPDGNHVIVRTYLGGYEFPADKKSLESWIKYSPERVTLASESQGEAVTYSLDSKEIWTTSEGNPFPVSRVKITND